MTSRLKNVIKDTVPPVFIRLFQKLRSDSVSVSDSVHFEGNYETWEDAATVAQTSYSSSFILESVRLATTKVRDGLAIAARDAVVFDSPQWNFPLIAALLSIAKISSERLQVLDFGGALGDSYFACRQFLNQMAELRWCVVEQPMFFECGRNEFQTDRLHFCPSIEASILEHQHFDVVLLSSVLPYLPDPFGLLEQLARTNIPWLIIDRTPVIDGPNNRLTVQKVPASIYGQPAAYPGWLFGYDSLLDELRKYWRVEVETQALDNDKAFDQGMAHFKFFFAKQIASRGTHGT